MYRAQFELINTPMSKIISAKEYPKLKPGEQLMFDCRSSSEIGRLLYAENRKQDLFDEDGKPTGEFVIVPHRVGYKPMILRRIELIDERVRVYSVHLEAGKFKISSL